MNCTENNRKQALFLGQDVYDFNHWNNKMISWKQRLWFIIYADI